MLDKTKTARLTKDLQAAIDAVMKAHGVQSTKIDLRRARDGSFVRLMKADYYVAGTLLAKASAAIKNENGLEAAMKRFGITKTKNAKGDRLIEYRASSPKYPFIYESARGAKWKLSPVQAAARFK